MKSLISKILVIITILFSGNLIFSSCAYSQQKNYCCAWMLWTVKIDKETKSQSWVISDAFPNYEACKKEQVKYEKRNLDKIISGDEVHRCFPDTFSPFSGNK